MIHRLRKFAKVPQIIDQLSAETTCIKTLYFFAKEILVIHHREKGLGIR